jgi:DNA-binding transcriptional LysR family regulator
MNQVESRPLRYFVAVAEELHFGRAAERLGIAQPPLSRAIRQLETQLGIRLLERSSRSVELTAAGEVLLDQARIALEALDAAVRRTERAAQPHHRLIVALKADNDGGLLLETITAYEAEHAAVPVELLLCGWGEQTRALRDGRADVALAYQPFDERGLDYEVLIEEAQLAALPSDHQLASRRSLCLADLESEPLPDWLGDNTAYPAPSVREQGSRDRRRPPVGDLTQLLKLIELGQMCAILPASVAERYCRAQVAYRPLIDAPRAALTVVWPQASRSLAVAAFVRAATSVAAGNEPRHASQA